MSVLETRLTRDAGIQVPLICGAMYPCSNPELIAAVSDAGGIGIVQPLSFVYVYGLDFREGLRRIRSLTDKPFGMNVLIEKTSQRYEDRMREWVDIALEEDCRFFITALGNPGWVVDRVAPVGGIVYHDVTERRWAEKALDNGVNGLICVNNRAGGHAGRKTPQELIDELADLNVPLVRAGGIGAESDFCDALRQGYDGVQMGTRFIATSECGSHSDYKEAIVNATADDIVHTERVTGIPLSVIKTPYVEKVGTKISPLSRWLFRHSLTKTWIRTYYNLVAFRNFRRSALKGFSTRDYWQAGRSVSGIDRIEPAGDIVRRFAEEARAEFDTPDLH